MFSPKFVALVQALRGLPSVGQKTAQRMALQLLEHDREGAAQLATAIVAALDGIGRCSSCRIFSETPVCPVCADQNRDSTQLCIVESPTDWMAIEQSGAYQGLYFILSGHLSPLDGIGPDDIGIPALMNRLANSPVEEIIMATSATIEGEATSGYIMDRVDPTRYKVTRLAQGVPMGGELEYLDAQTLSLALKSRRSV